MTTITKRNHTSNRIFYARLRTDAGAAKLEEVSEVFSYVQIVNQSAVQGSATSAAVRRDMITGIPGMSVAGTLLNTIVKILSPY